MRQPAIFVVALSLGFMPAVAFTQGVGDKIVVIKDNAPLRANDAITGRVWKGAILTVKNVNGDGLWVIFSETGHGTVKGWIDRSSVIPISRALDFFNEELSRNPTAPVFLIRGLIWYEKGEYDIAIRDFNEALRLDPKSSPAFSNRGGAWNLKKDYDQAISDSNEAIRLDPKQVNAYNNRGVAWLGKKESDKAISDFDEAIRLDPNYPLAFYNRGLARAIKKQHDKAIMDYDEALRLDPKHAAAYGYRGSSERSKGQLERAIADYGTAIELDPKNGSWYSSRAYVWIDKKDYDRAIADCDQSLGLDSKNAHSHYGRAIACMLQRRSEAVNGFQKVLDVQGWKGDRAVYAVILGSQSGRLLGNDAQARRFLDDSDGKLSNDWPAPVVRFLRHEFEEPALLTLATDNDKQTEAHCFIGLEDLIAGRRDQARQHFEWVQSKGTRHFIAYAIARAELKRLESSPSKR